MMSVYLRAQNESGDSSSDLKYKNNAQSHGELYTSYTNRLFAFLLIYLFYLFIYK